mgnify:CR=1 FL=1
MTAIVDGKHLQNPNPQAPFYVIQTQKVSSKHIYICEKLNGHIRMFLYKHIYNTHCVCTDWSLTFKNAAVSNNLQAV